MSYADPMTHYAKAVRRPNGRVDHWLVFAIADETITETYAVASFKTLTEARQWYSNLVVVRPGARVPTL